MSAIDQVIEWAQKELPDWQGDAARRILTQDRLTPQDKVDLMAMLKESNGLGDASSPAPRPIPLEKGQISGTPKSKVGVVLKALQGVQNVNAIPNDSYIPFGHDGLSVIYGENGAGKSGYGRILKRACSARDSSDPIHPNVFDSQIPGPAAATFKVGVDGRGDEELFWVDGGPKNDLLANIVVFDSQGARVIVDEENDISFLPYGTHVFEHLTGLLRELRGTLELERPVMARLDFKDVPPHTASGKFVSSISSATSLSDVAAAVEWTIERTQRLAAVGVKVSEAESPDRNAKIRRLKSIVALSKDLAAEILKIEAALPDAKIDVVRDAIGKVVATSKAQDIVTQQSASSESLPGVGSAVWQSLYNAAREYSIQTAYPALPFPVISEPSRCVLCQQPLLAEGKARLQRFHEFMEQATKKNAAAANAALLALLADIQAISFQKFAPATDLAQEILERDAGLAGRINAYFVGMKERADQVIHGAGQHLLPAMRPAIASPKDELGKLVDGIAAELAGLEKGLTPPELQGFKAELQELLARQALGTHGEELSQRISLLQKAQRLEAAIAATNLIAISARGKKIISESITPELQRALKVELEKMGAGHLPLDIEPTRLDGEVVHKLTLTKGKLPKKTPLTAILSEGEQRVVAIAGFLAELAASGSQSPIVLDDPVSSLDHKFRGKIARRLAEFAKDRQVIVFTHDIGFLIELEDCAAEIEGVKLAIQTIRRKGMVPGYSAQGNPWHAMKVTERTEMLLTKKLPQFESLHRVDMALYNPAAAELYGMLRETWEALVEEELLYKVIRRHSAAVQTKRLDGVEVLKDDYRAIYFAMKKCSEWMTGHDKSKTLDVDRPEPAQIRQDIATLVECRKVIGARRKQTQDERAQAIKATKPAIG